MPRPYEHKAAVESNGLYPYFVRFLEWTEVKGCSKDTVRRRHAALRRFINWCDERELQRPQEITKPILERYQRYLYYYRKPDGQPLTFGSQHVMLTPIRTFFRWLTKENYILYNPASELELPKKPKRLPKSILHVEEIEQVLNQPDIETLEGIRDRAILETFYSTGIRRMELVNLTIYDVDVRRSTLMVRQGKGGRDRVVPIGERALAWIEKYRLDVRPQLSLSTDNQTLFLNHNGRRFSRDSLSMRVKRYLTQAGIDRVGSCHLFRHAMATHMLENGADIRFIQAMLGHEDLSTTQIYTQVSIEKLREIHSATHPAKPLFEGKKSEPAEPQESALLAALEAEVLEE